MTDLASVYLVGFIGFFGLLMLFQEPIKKHPPPKGNAKQGAKAKRNGKPKKAIVKQNFTTEKPKKAKKAKWAKAPQLTEHEQREFDRYTFDVTKVRRQ